MVIQHNPEAYRAAAQAAICYVSGGINNQNKSNHFGTSTRPRSRGADVVRARTVTAAASDKKRQVGAPPLRKRFSYRRQQNAPPQGLGGASSIA